MEVSKLICALRFSDLFQLLHIQQDDRFTDIYVTDYTKSDRASTYLPERLRKTAKNLPPVLKITCWGDRDVTRELDVGSYYALKNVRIARDVQDGGLKGIMNDCNEKIRKIRSSSSDNAELALLLKYDLILLYFIPLDSSFKKFM